MNYLYKTTNLVSLSMIFYLETYPNLCSVSFTLEAKPKIVIIPGRVEKREEHKHGEKARVIWNDERVNLCKTLDYFDADKIKDLLTQLIKNPERNMGVGPESHNNELVDFVRKI